MDLASFYKNKVVLITGATSGIGEDLALFLAPMGARLVLVARRQEILNQIAENCRAAGAEVLALTADVADQSQMEAVKDSVFKAFDRIDVVVANAGIGLADFAQRMRLDQHRQTIEVNVIGLANTLIPFVEKMMEQRSGTLVGLSSLAGYRGMAGSASYCASKSAVWVFMESIRLDLKSYGIKACTIHPGFIKTPMTDKNRFKMPFLMDVRDSSVMIATAIVRGKPVTAFPWQMKLFLGFMRRLPTALYDFLMLKVFPVPRKLQPKD